VVLIYSKLLIIWSNGGAADNGNVYMCMYMYIQTSLSNSVLCDRHFQWHCLPWRRMFRQSVHRIWIGWGRTTSWPPCSPDLIPINLFLWEFLKGNVFLLPLPRNVY